MTSTELTLNRTLTDILEDELYNLHSSHGCGSEHCHSSNVSLNGKSLMNLPLPAFEEFMTNETLATDYNLSPPYHNDLYMGSPLPNMKSHQIPADNQSGGHELYGNSQPQQHQLSQSSNRHQLQSDGYRIFNKYADPSLTTTSVHDEKAQNKPANTPVQNTVNLNSIMKIPNPFNTTNISRLHPQSPVSRDIKVTNDAVDSSENVYGPRADDEFESYEDSYNYKMNWPLQDNNMALSNEDARMIFDHEFQHDDDLSEDEDDDETFEDESKKDIFNVPFSYSNDFNMNGRSEQVDTCNFVDSSTANTDDNMIADEVILDDDDDDSNMLDEDDLYEPSFRTNRKKSVVFNNSAGAEAVPRVHEHRKLDIERRREREGKGVSQNQQQPNPKFQTARNTLISGNTRVNVPKRKYSNLRNMEPLQDPNPQSQSHLHPHSQSQSQQHSLSPSPSEPYSKHKNSDDSEVYTCMIINTITKQSCAAQFSRSYDLTRHQNTIHAKKKSVFRCSECIKSLGHEGYQKTFSRLDALTRHIKSKHDYLSLEQRQDITKYARDNMGYVIA